MKRGYGLAALVDVMDKLLAPGGCPWDREQTLATLRPFLLEETYETLEAIDDNDAPAHCEELGDLLMQIVFQAALRQREGAFDIEAVCQGICDKLIRRHPHVFADAKGVDSSEKVLSQWQDIKDAEKRAKRLASGEAAQGNTQAVPSPRVLDGVPRTLPALSRAEKLGAKAGRVGFDWPGWEGSLGKVKEETAEVMEAAVANDAEAAHWEIGDLLFAVVNLARKLQVNPELALLDASIRFTQRFGHIEDELAKSGRRPVDSNLEEMDALWNQAKLRTFK